MPSREQAKAIRRDRIVAAARELIQETEETGFSMRALAERAGVSLVTPYKLFGSKLAVMQALLDEDINQYSKQLGRAKKDPLDMIFRAVSLGKTYFNREPRYYRAVLFAVYASGGPEYRSSFRGPRLALWRSLVDEAVTGGYLSRDADSHALAANLSSTYFASILSWVSGEISLAQMETRTHYGFAMVLYSMATRPHQARLKEAILDAQEKLHRQKLNRRKPSRQCAAL